MSSKLHLHNKDSLASFDPTRTIANADIPADLPPHGRSSPSIGVIVEEVLTPSLKKNRSISKQVSFESAQQALYNQFNENKESLSKRKSLNITKVDVLTSDMVGKLIEDLSVDAVLEIDDDD